MKKYQVLVPHNLSPGPSPEELSAARMLADFLKADVRFVKRRRIRTADFCINNLYWELKTPLGDGKRTIQHAMHNAARQSENLVLDLRKTKLKMPRALAQAKYYFVRIPRLKRLLIIEKNERVKRVFKK